MKNGFYGIMVPCGTKTFPEKIDITDPCYDKNVRCRMNDVKIVPGEYECFVEKNNSGDVRSIDIYLDDFCPEEEMGLIGEIGVDAGLAGFFIDKPDYSDDEWLELCHKLGDDNHWLWDVGFFSSSGYGDGCYPVLARKNENGLVDALKIVFIEQ